ncbi:Uncharacterised protein [Allocoprococcus comes]|nr:Uncharacterised protein [Coprococcus comes]
MSICIKDQIQNMNIVIGCTVGGAYCYRCYEAGI